MKKIYILVILLLPLLLYNCSSGKKAFENGNYYEAVLKAVNRLRQNPNHKKSKEILKRGYNYALTTTENDASIKLAGSDPFKYTEAIRFYKKINYMRDEIRRSPGALSVIPNPKSYHAKINDLKELATKENYRAGMKALARNTREDARHAYFLFLDAQEFTPGYKDVRNKIEEAKFKATLKVMVEQIPVPSRYNLSGGYFQDKIEEYLHTHFRSSEFVRFYNPEEVQTLPYVDQYLRIQFDDFVVGETHLLRNTETINRDSVIVGSVTLEDGSKKDVYNTVSAKLTVNRKEIISKGLLSLQVFDAQSKAMLHHRKFNGEFVWFSEWGNFNGDERALTDEQLTICESEELPPPNPQDLFIGFTQPIYNQLIPDINSYYRRF